MAKILVTDDAKFMRAMLINVIEKEGHECFEAVNGLDLLKKYGEIKPDLVTLDITMPEMDGLQAIKELKKRYPDAKVVMVSAMGQQAMVIDALQSGACDFIVKPFEQERVISCLKKFV